MDIEKVNSAREFLSHALLSVSEIGKILQLSSQKLLDTKVVYADLSNVDGVVKVNAKIHKMIALAKTKLEEVGMQSSKDLKELTDALGLPSDEPKLSNGVDKDGALTNNLDDSGELQELMEPETILTESDNESNLMEPETIITEEDDDDKKPEINNTEDIGCDGNGDSKEELSESDHKTFIKVVDINKLMEPKKSESVIVISDSDISSPEKQKNDKSKVSNKSADNLTENDSNSTTKCSLVKVKRLPNDFDKLMKQHSIKKVYDDNGKLVAENASKRSRLSKEIAKSKFETLRKVRVERSRKLAKKESDNELDSDDNTALPVPEFEEFEKIDKKSNLKDIASPKINKRVSFAKSSSSSNDSDHKQETKDNSDDNQSKKSDEPYNENDKKSKTNRLSVSKRNKKSCLRQSKNTSESSSDSDDEKVRDVNGADDRTNCDVKKEKEAKVSGDKIDDKEAAALNRADEEENVKNDDEKQEKAENKRILDNSEDDGIKEKKRKVITSGDEVDKLANLKGLDKKRKQDSASPSMKRSKPKKSNKTSNYEEEAHQSDDLDDPLDNDIFENSIDDATMTSKTECNEFLNVDVNETIVKEILDSADGDKSGESSSNENADSTKKPKRNQGASSKGSRKKSVCDPLLTEKLSDSDSDKEKTPQKEKAKEDEEGKNKGTFKQKKKRSENKDPLSGESEDDSQDKGEDEKKSDEGCLVEEGKPKIEDDNNLANKQSDNDGDDDDHKADAADNNSESDDSIIKMRNRKNDEYYSVKSDDKEEKNSDSDSDVVVSKRRRNVKRKKDSDDSDKSSDSDKKKKRKRVQRVKNSDDSSANGSGSDENSPNKGRKNIRKVLKTKNLDEATVQAAKEEKERKQRIEERQKLYNTLYDDKLMKEAKVDKLVLDFDPDTKEELITVHKKLVKNLKPHQANGVKFMFDACFESVKQIEKGYGSGCILAHCMGLGKSLQVVTLVHTLLTHYEQTKVRCVLVVCPLSTVLNWVNEFKIWLKNVNDGEDVNIFEISKFKQNQERAYQLSEWQRCGGVLIMGYDMFRNLSNEKGTRIRKKMKESLQKSLVDPGPDLIVCDEGHLLKNEKTSLSQAMTRVKTLRRIVLTGTPVQNNLKEYYCMVQFVKPNLLGKYVEYMNRFVNPITNGQYTDSTPRDIAIMKKRSHVLHKMLDGCVQRRDYSVLAPFLPPKHEYVLFINLTELQIKLYEFYNNNMARRMGPDRKNSSFLFPDFQNFQRIWTHPRVLKANSERYERDQAKKAEKDTDSEGSLEDFIDDSETTDSETSASSINDSDDSEKKAVAKRTANASARNTRASRRQGNFVEEENPVALENEEKKENPTEWWMPLCPEEELYNLKHSGKLMLLFEILKECETIGDKILVFSQSLYSLDVIEQFLSQIDDRTQNNSDSEDEDEDEEKKKEKKEKDPLLGHRGSWSLGLDYFRLDGSTSCENRAAWCKSFNRPDNLRARLFLISTRAGGLGINLVAANRVIIFDVSWNPSHDVQSIFRVYRFGQKKPCYIYRFIARGTMEEKVYERQVTKQAISKRVIDEQQIDRHYNSNDLNELYKFEPIPPEPRPTPKLPKDRLFAELLHNNEKLIYHFHEHDSLLENKEEETLNEEERKAAWEEFENEKKAPPPQPYYQQYSGKGNFGTGSNLFGIPMNMVLTLLTMMVKSDNPMLNDEEVKMVIPTMSQKMIAATQAGDFSIVERMKRLWMQQQNMYLQQQYNNLPYSGQQYAGVQNQQMLIQQQQMLLKQQQQQQLLKQQQLQSQQNMLNQQQSSKMVNPYNKIHNQQGSALRSQLSKNPSLVPNPAALSKRKLPTMQDFVDLDSD